VAVARQAKNIRISSGVALVSHRGGRRYSLPIPKDFFVAI